MTSRRSFFKSVLAFLAGTLSLTACKPGKPKCSGGQFFKDVNPSMNDAGYYINCMGELGYFKGKSTDNAIFAPFDALTRGEVAVLILRAKFGQDYEPPKNDATYNYGSKHWSAPWYGEAIRYGLMFPSIRTPYDLPVTRADIAVLMALLLEC